MAVLKMKQEAGSVSETFRSVSLPSGVAPFTVPSGDGAAEAMKSSRHWIPWEVTLAPQSTGKSLPLFMPFASPLRISSEVRFPSAKNFSMRESSPSAALSTSFCRAASTAAFALSGTAASLSPIHAFCSMRSTTPVKSAPAPIGTTTGTNVALNFSVRSATQRSKSARSFSILFTKMKRGISRRARRRQSLIVSICTPTSAPTTSMQESETRKAATTSPTKSADPGVSRMLIL